MFYSVYYDGKHVFPNMIYMNGLFVNSYQENKRVFDYNTTR